MLGKGWDEDEPVTQQLGDESRDLAIGLGPTLISNASRYRKKKLMNEERYDILIPLINANSDEDA